MNALVPAFSCFQHAYILLNPASLVRTLPFEDTDILLLRRLRHRRAYWYSEDCGTASGFSITKWVKSISPNPSLDRIPLGPNPESAILDLDPKRIILDPGFERTSLYAHLDRVNVGLRSNRGK
jgi:hypothetical protein